MDSAGHVAVVNSLIAKGENVDAATNVSNDPYAMLLVVMLLYNCRCQFVYLILLINE